MSISLYIKSRSTHVELVSYNHTQPELPYTPPFECISSVIGNSPSFKALFNDLPDKMLCPVYARLVISLDVKFVVT